MSSYAQPMKNAKVRVETGEYLYEFEPDKLEFSSSSNGVSFSGWTWGLTVTKIEGEIVDCKIPELYPENLETLRILSNRIAALAEVPGVFEVEIRVRLDDLSVWAVIGYGEAGDPCVLRFEKDA